MNIGTQPGERRHEIKVHGSGNVALAPDIVLLQLSVEVLADSVSEARGEAATAMNAVMEVLRARGIDERDIRTTRLEISPEFEYEEVYREGRRVHDRVFTGYEVTNSVAVKVRDLDAVGDIVDEVAEAGGDDVRVESVRFRVEDNAGARREAREKAVLDAIDKADQLASHAGVIRSNLIHISESHESEPMPPVYSSFVTYAPMAEDASSPTPLSGGELEIKVSVYAVFAIEGR